MLESVARILTIHTRRSETLVCASSPSGEYWRERERAVVVVFYFYFFIFKWKWRTCALEVVTVDSCFYFSVLM